MNRNKEIVKTSILGIIVNVILVAFKVAIGLITNSIAIILDAVNNLSDALSSIITIIGTKLSNMRPNKKHPYGYGRIEYFSSVIIAFIVLFAGITSFKESIEKIIHPEDANYSYISLVIIVVAVLVKFFFGRYVKSKGEKLNSSALVASGMDAVNDSILSFSTLVAALISMIWHVSLEGYLGVIISLIILKASIEILKDTINDMIGVRADGKLTSNVRKTIKAYEGVLGVYDITLHNYGPNSVIASAHIEVKDDMNVQVLHRLTRKIELDIYEKYGIILTLGVYASNETKEFKEIKNFIQKSLKQEPHFLQMHGFYVDIEERTVSFDVIFSFDEENPLDKIETIKKKLKEKYPQYTYSIILDTDISD